MTHITHESRAHTSIPRNPFAEPMFLAHYAEKGGNGILDMIARCRVTPQTKSFERQPKLM